MKLLLLLACFYCIACGTEAQVEKSDVVLLKPGLLWAEETTEVTSHGTGEFSTEGIFSEEGHTWDDANGETKSIRVSKVLRHTHTEVFNKPGALVQSIEEVTPDPTTNLEISSPPAVLQEHVLVEVDGWLRSLEPLPADSFLTAFLGADQNSLRGTALYPVAPQSGKYYTNDSGIIMRARDTEALKAGNATRLEVQFPEPLIALDTFYKTCFTEGKLAPRKILSVVGWCKEILALNGPAFNHKMLTLWINGPILMRQVVLQEDVTLESVCCGEVCSSITASNVYSGYYDLPDCREDDPVYFTGERERTIRVTEVTRFSRDTDPLSPPTLEDAEAKQ